MAVEVAVYIVHRGQKAGPFSLRELKRQVASGNITRETLVWYKGMEEWAPLSVAFSEEIEIADIPRSQSGNTPLSLIRDENPPMIPESVHAKWGGPGSGGGKLFIPGKRSGASLSTPEWEKKEAARIQGRNPAAIALKGAIIAALVGLLWFLLK